jgi:hypothetical protein
MSTAASGRITDKEVEQLKPWISKTITALLGFEEPTVEAVAMDSIQRGLAKHEIQGKRKFHTIFRLTRNAGALNNIADGEMSQKFVDALYREVQVLRDRKPDKRKREDEGNSSHDDKRYRRYIL